MCYSFESNYHSWLAALVGAALFLVYGTDDMKTNIWISLFTLTFSQIQVIESTIWKLLENKNIKDANKMAKYIIPLLWSQPLVQSFMGYNATNNNFLLIMSFIYLIIMLIEFNAISSDSSEMTIDIGTKGNLVWSRFSNNTEVHLLTNKLLSLLYIFGLFMPILYLQNNDVLKYSLLGFGSLSLLYSYQTSSIGEYTSKWCNISVLYIYVALIITISQRLNK